MSVFGIVNVALRRWKVSGFGIGNVALRRWKGSGFGIGNVALRRWKVSGFRIGNVALRRWKVSGFGIGNVALRRWIKFWKAWFSDKFLAGSLVNLWAEFFNCFQFQVFLVIDIQRFTWHFFSLFSLHLMFGALIFQIFLGTSTMRKFFYYCCFKCQLGVWKQVISQR